MRDKKPPDTLQAILRLIFLGFVFGLAGRAMLEVILLGWHFWELPFK